MNRIVGTLLIAIVLLFGATFLTLYLGTKPEDGWLINNSEVGSSAVFYKQRPYTLNFDQQRKLLSLINQSKEGPIEEITSTAMIDKIVLYRFDAPDLILTPTSASYATFAVSGWDPSKQLWVHRHQKLKTLLKTTYEH